MMSNKKVDNDATDFLVSPTHQPTLLPINSRLALIAALGSAGCRKVFQAKCQNVQNVRLKPVAVAGAEAAAAALAKRSEKITSNITATISKNITRSSTATIRRNVTRNRNITIFSSSATINNSATISKNITRSSTATISRHIIRR